MKNEIEQQIFEKMKAKDFGESMCNETKLNVLKWTMQQLRKHDVSGSLHLADFIEEIEYMQGLYSNARYTQAEATRDKLAEQLDDLMRLGQQ